MMWLHGIKKRKRRKPLTLLHNNICYISTGFTLELPHGVWRALQLHSLPSPILFFILLSLKKKVRLC